MAGATKITLNKSFEIRAANASVTVTSEPIEHVFDPASLGKGPATTIAELIAEQLAGITELAKDSTIRKREIARRALARGPAWAVERYRTRSPSGSRRLFVDSGRLGELALKLVGDAWHVLAPSDRLDGETFKGDELERMIERLRALVPALRAPLEQPEVRAAIAATIPEIIRVRRR